MASEVEICNLALSRIGAGATISDLSEESQEAFHCNLVYASARDAVLRDFPWSFAKKYKKLSVATTSLGKWSYAYTYPNDALSVRSILQADDAADPIKFEIALKDDNVSKVILTNQENAELVYTAKVTDATLFDALFIQALSWRIASEVAMPLTRDANAMQSAYQMYQSIVADAQLADARESYDTIERDAEWVRGR